MPDKTEIITMCESADLLNPTDWLSLNFEDLMILNEANIWTMSVDHARCMFADDADCVPATLLLDVQEPTRHNTANWNDSDEDDDEFDDEFGEYEIQPRAYTRESIQDYTLRMAANGVNTDEDGMPNLVCSIWYNGYKVKEPYLTGDIYHYEQDCPYGMEQFTTTIRDWFNTIIRPMCILKILNEDCADTIPYGMRMYSKNSICRLDPGVGSESFASIWKWLGGEYRSYAPHDYFPVDVHLKVLTMPKEKADQYRQWLHEYVEARTNDRT